MKKFLTAALIPAVFCLFSCNWQNGGAAKVNIDSDDSVYVRTDNYVLEDLGFENYDYNSYLCDTYGDTIRAVVAIYDSYDVITGSRTVDEADASLAWYESARNQIADFFHKDTGDLTEDDIDKVFKVAEGIFDYYSCGTQYDLNLAAARRMLIADYRLLDAYSRLMGCFPTAEISALVHDDYKYMMDTINEYAEYRYERDYYTDLPRELGCTFINLFLARCASINSLMAVKADEQAAAENLSGHFCLENGCNFSLTFDKLVAGE